MTFSADYKTIESGTFRSRNSAAATISTQRFGTGGLTFNLLEDQESYYY